MDDTAGMHPHEGTEYLFGPFRFIPAQRALLHGSARMRLGGRALEILALLLERPGELVSKRELIARAWAGSVVEDSNVKVHVAALRRALGECEGGPRYIGTVNGRGYCFVAPTRAIAETAPARAQAPAGRTIGRDAAIEALARLLTRHRFATVVGPGGIGKTTVAQALMQALSQQQALASCFVDLSPLADQRFVAATVAAALGLSVHAGEIAPALIASLRDRRMLLVLDSCEHVIDAAAVLAERIVAAAPGVLILCTSREPLRAGGECVQRLAALEVPAPGEQPTAAQALRYSAVQLFVERAAEIVEGYALNDADAPAVAAICRRLEGIPLAIELAATRIESFGAQELALRLDDRFRLLERGRRSAQPRHRTLAAALDWSYAYLPPAEQKLLRAVSVFAGAFTLDDAAALCADAGLDVTALADGVAGLVAKSLLASDTATALTHYRLLDTTKAYANARLHDCGEAAGLRRRHGHVVRAMFQRAAVEWEGHPTSDWLAHYGKRIDDVRSALAWAMADGGERATGIELTVAAIPLWTHLSLLDECRHWVDAALDPAAPAPAPRDEMKLHAARGAAMLYACGPMAGTEQAWTRALALAQALDDSEYELRALWGLAVYRSYFGEYRQALALAERFRAIAAGKGDRAARIGAARLIATSLHYLGDQDGARSHLETMLRQYVAPVYHSHVARFQLDQRAAALGTLANVLWVQGLPDQAVRAAREALQAAREANHALSLLNALVHAACPVSLYVGDRAETGRLLAELFDHSARHGLSMWDALCRCLRGMALVQAGEAAGTPLLHDAVADLRRLGLRLRFPAYLAVLAARLGEQGEKGEALRVIGEALACSSASGEAWCRAELLRVEGELQEALDPDAAERCYAQSLALARTQGALAWQLRTATSLARLRRRQGRAGEGGALLAGIYAQFSEGFGTLDLAQARDELERAGVEGFTCLNHA